MFNTASLILDFEHTIANMSKEEQLHFLNEFGFSVEEKTSAHKTESQEMFSNEQLQIRFDQIYSKPVKIRVNKRSYVSNAAARFHARGTRKHISMQPSYAKKA